MNHLLKNYLIKFVLVFFDDILIYSLTWDNYLQHVDQIIQFLQDHKFFSNSLRVPLEWKKLSIWDKLWDVMV